MSRYTMQRDEHGYLLADVVQGEAMFIPYEKAEAFEDDMLNLSKLFDADVVAAMLWDKYKPHGRYDYIRYE